MPTPICHKALEKLSFIEVARAVGETTQDKVSAAVATGLMTTPLWQGHLKDVSEISGLLAPILGCLWLAVQIVVKILGALRSWRAHDERS